MSTQTKTVLITGSSSGIGLDIARAFLAKGSSVVLNGRNADKLTAAAEKLGHPERVAVVPGSIADRETGEAMVRAAVERFDSVDVLVNNAGTFAAKPFVDVRWIRAKLCTGSANGCPELFIVVIDDLMAILDKL